MYNNVRLNVFLYYALNINVFQNNKKSSKAFISHITDYIQDTRFRDLVSSIISIVHCTLVADCCDVDDNCLMLMLMLVADC